MMACRAMWQLLVMACRAMWQLLVMDCRAMWQLLVMACRSMWQLLVVACRAMRGTSYLTAKTKLSSCGTWGCRQLHKFNWRVLQLSIYDCSHQTISSWSGSELHVDAAIRHLTISGMYVTLSGSSDVWSVKRDQHSLLHRSCYASKCSLLLR